MFLEEKQFEKPNISTSRYHRKQSCVSGSILGEAYGEGLMMTNESMTSIERIEKAINLEEADRVPVAPIISYDAARHYGITVEEFFWNPKKAEEAYEYTFNKLGGVDFVTLNAARTYDNFYSPLFEIFSLFYFNWKFPEKETSPNFMPQMINPGPLIDEKGYDLLIREGAYRFFNFKNAKFGDLDKFFDSMRAQKVFLDNWTRQYKVSPWRDTVIYSTFDFLELLRGLKNLFTDIYRRPEKVIELSEWLSDCLIALATFPMQNGQDTRKNKIILLSNLHSHAGNLSPKQFERFSLPYLKKMVEEFAKDGFIVHIHNHGNWTPFLEYFREFPKKKCILCLDHETDIFKAKEILGDRICLMGNLPATILSFGTPKEVEDATKKIIDGCAEGGGLIINCEDPLDTKFENLKTLVDTVKKYGIYRR
jgi:uroporphyrinogen-III decarboxylase